MCRQLAAERLALQGDRGGVPLLVQALGQGGGAAVRAYALLARLGEEVALPLPEGALPAVFRRYGKPLEDAVTPTLVAPADDDDQPLAVPLRGGGRARLWRFRFMPFGWVHPADYLLWEGAGDEPLAAPAPLVASALSALARAAAG